MTHPQRGFTLLEVLVAFAIASLAIAILMQIFSVGLRNVDTAGEYSRGTAVAEALLAKVGVDTPLNSGDLEGTEGQFQWKLQIEPVPDRGTATGTPGGMPPLFGLMAITATVSWPTGIGRISRSVILTTARIAKRP